MVIERRHRVFCNGCGIRGPLVESGTEARRIAKRAGWTRVPKRSASAGGSPGADYCPTCGPKAVSNG